MARDIQIRTRCPCQWEPPVRIAWELVELLQDLGAGPDTILITARCRHCGTITVTRLGDIAPPRAA